MKFVFEEELGREEESKKRGTVFPVPLRLSLGYS